MNLLIFHIRVATILTRPKALYVPEIPVARIRPTSSTQRKNTRVARGESAVKRNKRMREEFDDSLSIPLRKRHRREGNILTFINYILNLTNS